MNNEYNAESIKVLSDIEHIKKRKGLYIGEATHPGHLFYEIFDNAADEFLTNPTLPIDIKIDTESNEYLIRDYGRGIPHGTMKLEDGTEKEVIEVIYTKLNSGGKFDNSAYKISSGLHGQGSTAVNALSSRLIAVSYRDGNMVSASFNHGELVIPIMKDKTTQRNGTSVSFIPDSEFFENPKIPKEFILNRCRISSAFGIKTNLLIDGNKIDTDADIYSLIIEDEDISIYTKFDSKVEDEATGESFVFAIEYTNDTSCKSKAYTNLIPNTQGGTHVKIFYEAFEKAWSKFNIPDIILSKDTYLGLRFVVAAFISETEFSSQTKERLTINKKTMEKFVDPISDKIYQFLNENDDIRNGLIKRFQEHRASLQKLLDKKEISDYIIINNDTSGKVRRKSVVSKLIECSSKNREGTELFIVEGDSAAGSLIQARDVKTQAIIPIRGKILNTSKVDIVRAIKNAEVRDIVNAAGTGIGDDCDATRSRYSKYIITADADVDGLQIDSLNMALFINLLPGVVKAGMLYIANPPLYEWYDSKGNYCFTNDQNKVPDGVKYSRNKGLGEMDPPELYQSVMNPETRILTRVNYPEDINRFNEILTSPSVKYQILYELGLIEYIE